MGQAPNESHARQARAAREAQRRRPAGTRQARSPLRLRDLYAEGLDLFCWCLRCDHNGTVGIRGLLARLGPAATLPAVAARLRCSRCGARAAEVRPAWPPVGQIAGHTPLAPLGRAKPGTDGPGSQGFGDPFTGP